MDKYSKINIYKEYKEYYELLIENQILPNGKAPSSFTPEYIDNMIKFKNRYSNLTIPNINMILKEKKYYDDIPSYPDLEKIKNQTANMLHLLQSNNTSGIYDDIIQYLSNIDQSTYTYVYESGFETAVEYNKLLSKEQIDGLYDIILQKYSYTVVQESGKFSNDIIRGLSYNFATLILNFTPCL